MIRVANAPCSWGALEFDLEGETAGYARVLDEIRETGYNGTELGDWGFMPTDPKRLADELAARQLELLGAFVPVALANANKHATGCETARKTARLLRDAGFPDARIVLADENGSDPRRTRHAGRIQPAHGLDDAAWKNFASGADRIAKAVRKETGLATVFHHHCAGYVETPEEISQLMARTDPDLVKLVLDTGHCAFGGGDPLAALKEFGPRITYMHFKDCHPGIADESRDKGWDYFESVKRGVFCELGKGGVDFPAVLEELCRQNYEGWIVVEQDVLPGMGEPKTCARNNRAYLAQLGLR